MKKYFTLILIALALAACSSGGSAKDESPYPYGTKDMNQGLRLDSHDEEIKERERMSGKGQLD